MNTFANAIQNQMTTTTNDMPARVSSANPLVDFFYQAGAMRGRDIIPLFIAAFLHDPVLALRITLWLRDVREGAGERQLFRNILQYLEDHNTPMAIKLMSKIPEVGRWDDLLCVQRLAAKAHATDLIGEALSAGNGLCAKWLPRKGKEAAELRKRLSMTPKMYRKILVSLTQVVETQMCANEWDSIEFSKVPSVASARYKKAFNRHTQAYGRYVSALINKEPGVKVNIGAVYPYDVLKGKVTSYGIRFDETEENFIMAQWDALPNFIGSRKILPMVDVSGSMDEGGSNIKPIEVSVSLGLYLADKNQGAFKDAILTFSASPQLVILRGNILQKINSLVRVKWDMNTDIYAAFKKVLEVAKNGQVAPEDMPETILILSDMQFDRCVNEYSDTALQMIQRGYSLAGYKVPNIVFWNLNAHNNVPVKFDERGTAMVSSFSVHILKAILSGEMSPEGIMMKAIMNERYSF